jgi:hypothetical protein
MGAVVVGALISAVATIGAAWIATRPRQQALPPEAHDAYALRISYSTSTATVHASGTPTQRPGTTGRGVEAAPSEPEPQPDHRAAAPPVGPRRGLASRIAPVFDPIWRAVYKLPPLNRRVSTLWATVVAYFFSGIGVAVYFRTKYDVVIGAVLFTLLAIAVSVPNAQVLAYFLLVPTPLYAFFRARSSNSRREYAEGGIAPGASSAVTS